MAGIKPDEFWEMTPREYTYWMDGFKWRMDNEALIKAHFTACLMNMFTSKKIKASDLWKTTNQAPKRKKPIDQSAFEETLAAMGPDAIPLKRK